MFSELITAFILGLVGGAVPGPVLASIFTEILQSGFYRSLRIVLWAMLTEIVVALTCLLVFSSAGFSQSFFSWLSIVGAGILIWISIQLWKIKSLETGERIKFSPGKIAAMILANGVLWTFWITICIPKAIELSKQFSYGQFIFLCLFELGWFVSTIIIASIFSWFRNLLSNPKFIPIVFKVFSGIFFYFALSMLYKSVNLLL